MGVIEEEAAAAAVAVAPAGCLMDVAPRLPFLPTSAARALPTV
jgi:hypothetical protein